MSIRYGIVSSHLIRQPGDAYLLSRPGEDMVEEDPRKIQTEGGGAVDFPGHGHRPVTAVPVAAPAGKS